MANLQQNSELQKFPKGFHSFIGMNVQPDHIIVTTPRGRTENAYQAAQDHINARCLDLRVERTGHPLTSNTFIVKPNECSTFERLSEQLYAEGNLRHV